MKVAASTVWEILQEARIGPAPERASSTWTDFLRSQADALLAQNFFRTVNLSGARLYVFVVIKHAKPAYPGSGRDRPSHCILGGAGGEEPRHGSRGCRLPRPLHDQGSGKYSALFDKVPKHVGIERVLTGIRVPRMNSIMERWV